MFKFLLFLPLINPSVACADALNINLSLDKKLNPSKKSVEVISKVLKERDKLQQKGVVAFYIRASFETEEWKTALSNIKDSFESNTRMKFILLRFKKSGKQEKVDESFVSFYGLSTKRKEWLSKFAFAEKTEAFKPSLRAVRYIQQKEVSFLKRNRPVEYYRGEEIEGRAVFADQSSQENADFEQEALSLLRTNLSSKASYVKDLSRITKKEKAPVEKLNKDKVKRLPASLKK